MPPRQPRNRISRVDPKKIPSDREYQLLAVLVRNERAKGKDAEMNGRQIAKAYEDEIGEKIPYGTVYTLLDAMEVCGWLRSREYLFEGRRTRWYKTNKRGLDAVHRWRERKQQLLALTDPVEADVKKSTKAERSAGSGDTMPRTS